MIYSNSFVFCSNSFVFQSYLAINQSFVKQILRPRFLHCRELEGPLGPGFALKNFIHPTLDVGALVRVKYR